LWHGVQKVAGIECGFTLVVEMNKLERIVEHDAGARAVRRCEELGCEPYSDMRGGLFRPYLGAAHKAAMATLRGWMHDAGMSVRTDPAGTVIGRYEGMEANAPALLIGSHIDSVWNGGFYDGVLGVMLGVECVAAFASRGIRLPFALEVVAFGDEEGSRFPLSMLGSRAMAGKAVGDVSQMRDRTGATLHEAMRGAGLDVGRMGEARRNRQDILAYLEAHIEQGPVLEHADAPLAAVSAIAGIQRFYIRVQGQAGHAGTVPLSMRHDALAAACEMVLGIEALACAHGDDFVATVGRIEAHPGAVNVIPGSASLSVEIRSADAQCLERAFLQVKALVASIAGRRRVGWEVRDHQTFAPAPCDGRLVDLLRSGIKAEGMPEHVLVSGAGHDAMMMTDWVPTAMLFLRSPGGISHHPDESVIVADVQAAFAVMVNFITRLPEVLDISARQGTVV
jgi:allantoate deiminase